MNTKLLPVYYVMQDGADFYTMTQAAPDPVCTSWPHRVYDMRDARAARVWFETTYARDNMQWPSTIKYVTPSNVDKIMREDARNA